MQRALLHQQPGQLVHGDGERIGQQEIAEKIDSNVSHSHWKDWRWQTRHRIRDIETIEELLEIRNST